MPLGEIAVNRDNARKPIKKNERVGGTTPYYGASGVVDYVSGYTHDGEFLLVSEDGANLIARTYPIAFAVNGKNWINNHAHVLEFENLKLQRLVEVYLNSISLETFISKGAQPKLTKQELSAIKVPVPEGELLDQTVEYLELFDALVNDISQGLPAEIEARRKQYEYYRDKLLTFKEKAA